MAGYQQPEHGRDLDQVLPYSKSLVPFDYLPDAFWYAGHRRHCFFGFQAITAPRYNRASPTPFISSFQFVESASLNSCTSLGAFYQGHAQIVSPCDRFFFVATESIVDLIASDLYSLMALFFVRSLISYFQRYLTGIKSVPPVLRHLSSQDIMSEISQLIDDSKLI